MFNTLAANLAAAAPTIEYVDTEAIKNQITTGAATAGTIVGVAILAALGISLAWAAHRAGKKGIGKLGS